MLCLGCSLRAGLLPLPQVSGELGWSTECRDVQGEGMETIG